MDYKKEIGRRIREARLKKGWILQDLEARTGLSYQRIGAYETGERMPKPGDIVTIASALGLRAAYIAAYEDWQEAPSPQAMTLLKNWSTLTEKVRMDFFRDIEYQADESRDATPETGIPYPRPRPGAVGKRPAARIVKKGK